MAFVVVPASSIINRFGYGYRHRSGLDLPKYTPKQVITAFLPSNNMGNKITPFNQMPDYYEEDDRIANRKAFDIVHQQSGSEYGPRAGIKKFVFTDDEGNTLTPFNRMPAYLAEDERMFNRRIFDLLQDKTEKVAGVGAGALAGGAVGAGALAGGAAAGADGGGGGALAGADGGGGGGGARALAGGPAPSPLAPSPAGLSTPPDLPKGPSPKLTVARRASIAGPAKDTATGAAPSFLDQIRAGSKLKKVVKSTPTTGPPSTPPDPPTAPSDTPKDTAPPKSVAFLDQIAKGVKLKPPASRPTQKTQEAEHLARTRAVHTGHQTQDEEDADLEEQAAQDIQRAQQIEAAKQEIAAQQQIANEQEIQHELDRIKSYYGTRKFGAPKTPEQEAEDIARETAKFLASDRFKKLKGIYVAPAPTVDPVTKEQIQRAKDLEAKHGHWTERNQSKDERAKHNPVSDSEWFYSRKTGAPVFTTPRQRAQRHLHPVQWLS